MEGIIWIVVGLVAIYFPVRFLRDDQFARSYIQNSPKAFLWRKIFGEEKALKITKTIFAPLGILLGIALIVFGIYSMSSPNKAELQEGSLYSIVDSEGKVKVVKILVIDPDGVHIRLYRNAYAERPQRVDPASLALGKPDDPEGFSIGHLPVTKAVFQRSDPVFIQQVIVLEDELEGYKMWREGSGGYWGMDL